MKILKKSIGVFILCFVFQNAVGQSGFLGSTFNVELEVDSRVNIIDVFLGNRSKLSVETGSVMILKNKTRLITTSYNLGVNKVINDNIQIGIKVGINPLLIYIRTLTFKDSNQAFQYQKSLLSNFVGSATSFSVNFKKYNKGIAPIGKYFGFNLGGVNAKLKGNQVVKIGEVGGSKYKLLTERATIISDENFTFTKGGKVKNVFLNFTMGETIPVMKKIGINFELSFPLLRVFMFENGGKNLGFGIKDPKGGYNFGPTDLSSNLAFALKKSQGIRFNVGVKFFL